MSIRLVELKDIRDIIEINKLCRKQTYETIFGDIEISSSKESEVEKRENRISNFDDKIFYVKQIADKVVGYIYAIKNKNDEIESDMEIFAIYVNPNYQRQGIGKELFEFFISKARLLGYKSFYLWVLDENHQAKSFYEKNGGKYAGSKFSNIHGKDVKESLYICKILIKKTCD